jgi:predicted phospho-2-dehydro-3-deoxyheptonate aldolase
MIGKGRRMRRILKSGKTFIVPMDHGITKPSETLSNIDRVLSQIEGIADAVVLHKGVAKHSCHIQRSDMGLIIHLSASTSISPDPNRKTIVGSVEKAIQLGADAVSIHVNIGSDTEHEQLKEAGFVAEVCDDFSIPLLAMVYARGVDLEEKSVDNVIHAARVGYELGADIVKVTYTGSLKSFAKVVESVGIPVVMAGGSKKGEEELLLMIRDAVLAGAAGVAVGRNVFEHPKPQLIARAIRMIVHEDVDVEEAMVVLNEGDMANMQRK